MNQSAAKILTVVVEREFPHPPERIWQALTQPHLIAEWLMRNDFSPHVGHKFTLSADWGAVECEVLSAEPMTRLVYSWRTKDLDSTVTWSLSATKDGTVLRMEQSGFRQDQKSYFKGAKAGWPRFLRGLDELLAQMDRAVQQPDQPTSKIPGRQS